ncbi:MAG: hypothetical protein ACERKV_02090 [Clostridiaceae bacterium]
MNKKINKFISSITAASLVFSITITANANVLKDETIYVNLDNRGNVTEQTVSSWLHSDETSGEIKDKSNLSDIINIKGDEVPVIDGDNITWTTDSPDIYYKGATDKKLPISTEVSYKLDGKSIEPSELAGKSGEVEISVKLTNNLSVTKEISGETRTIYTPFTTIVALDLPIDSFKNVEINSGKLISDGNNQVVTFVTVPGLMESLDLDQDIKDEYLDLDMPDTLTIKADVENFELGSIVITGTPDIPNLDEIDSASTIEELQSSMNDLKDASTKLKDATVQLADGATELNENMASLNTGLAALYSGSTDLKNGTSDLQSGLTAANAGSDTLAAGMETIETKTNYVAESIGALKAGIDQANTGALKVKAGQDQLTAGLSDTTGIDKLIAGKEAELVGINALLAGVTNLQSALSAIDSISFLSPLVTLTTLSDGLTGINDGLVELQTSSNQLIAGLEQTKTGMLTASATSKALSDGLQEVIDGQTKLSENAALLQAGTNQLVAEGITPAKEGAADLAAGLDTASAGSKALTDGAATLNSGLATAADGSSQLADGSNQLADGSVELKDGMSEFDKDGIEELNSKVTTGIDDVQELIDTKDAIVDLAENYESFSGKTDSMESSTKFVMKTEAISIQEVETDDTVTKTEEKTGFWNWIKGLFD